MKIDIWQKDMSIIGSFARSLGVATPTFSASAPVYNAAIALGLGADDTATGGPASRRTVTVWHDPLAWHVTFYMGMQSLLFYGPLSWLPAIFRYAG